MSTIAAVHPLTPRPRPAARRVAPRPAQRSDGSQVRLTRRGRLVVLAASLLLVLGVFVLLGSGSVASRDAGTPPPTEIVRVTEGQTLWGIASERAEHGGEIREVMREIERLNALESGMLTVGQRLRVPATE